MHPWSNDEHIVRSIHVYDQKLVKVLYFAEPRLDGTFPQWSSLVSNPWMTVLVYLRWSTVWDPYWVMLTTNPLSTITRKMGLLLKISEI